ncbi:PIN domain-containing protein [Mycobacteroides abscessus]|uniref:PIN domain-containing protein n=1 Tax=Mycobacteroides abscessus TaxID=36809 RepID=UPI001F3A919E|nr:PIN domain-containing protein [Mycobacteroides abscessus]
MARYRRTIRRAGRHRVGCRPRRNHSRYSRPLGHPVRALLDTSVVIATDVAALDGELAISAVTLAELHFGVLVAKQRAVRAERLRRLLLLQRSFDALPLDEAVAASYGQIAAAVVDAGRKPRARSMDLLIAATAHAHAAKLYTRNADDFRGIEELVDVIEV